MINLFVYVDNKDAIKPLTAKIHDFFRGVKKPIQVIASFDPDVAVDYIQKNKGKIDACFIDFSNPEKSLKLVKLYYHTSQEALWIFMNQSIKFLVQYLHFRPACYMRSLEDKRLQIALNLILYTYAQKVLAECFTFKCEGEYIRVPYSKITYMESQCKKVCIHLCDSDKKYEFPDKLDRICEIFPDCFLKCHQSYVVNLHLVRILNRKTQRFTLYSGDTIFISRRMMKTVSDRYLEFTNQQVQV